MFLQKDGRGDGIEHAVVLPQAAKIDAGAVALQSERLGKRAVLRAAGADRDLCAQTAQAQTERLSDLSEADHKTAAPGKRDGQAFHGKLDRALRRRDGVSGGKRRGERIVGELDGVLRKGLCGGGERPAEYECSGPERFQDRNERERLRVGAYPAVLCQRGHGKRQRLRAFYGLLETGKGVFQLRHLIDGDLKAALAQLLRQPALPEVAAEYTDASEHDIPSFLRHCMRDTCGMGKENRSFGAVKRIGYVSVCMKGSGLPYPTNHCVQ